MSFYRPASLWLSCVLVCLITISPDSRALGLEPDETYRPGILLAQGFEAGDAYDPFADYTEFEATEEEEADINFFRNGRFFTMGFIGGYRTMTETLGKIYDDAFTAGLFISYFFDLRFALQLQFLSGDHAISFVSPSTGRSVNGNASITTLSLNLKYFINTQNVTRGLANLNPYVIGGFSQVYRTATVSGEEAFSKEGAMGFDLGGGIEIPVLRNKMYLGAQLTYQLVNFADENSEIVLSNDDQTGLFPTGDAININFVLGVNF